MLKYVCVCCVRFITINLRHFGGPACAKLCALCLVVLKLVVLRVQLYSAVLYGSLLSMYI